MNKITDKQGRDPEEVVQQFRDYVQRQRHWFDLDGWDRRGQSWVSPSPAHVITMGAWTVTYVVHQLADQRWVHHMWVVPARPGKRFTWQAMEAISHALTDNARPLRECCCHLRPGEGLPGQAWHIFVHWYDPSLN